MKILNMYRNGNYNVMICDDGTKMRFNNEHYFNPQFPESIDMKITNYCPYDCPYCHEDSSVNGRRADLIVKNNGDKIKDSELLNITYKDCKLKNNFFQTLRAGTEVAIGGGAVTYHPHLEIFLTLLKNRGIIANMTINEKEINNNQTRLQYYMQNNLIHGLGISFVNDIADNHKSLNEFIDDCERKGISGNIVIHIIAGVASEETIELLRDRGLKVLILGYKDFRRGIDFHKTGNIVDDNFLYLKKNLSTLINSGAFETVSFDNLAIKQLEVQNILRSDIFKKMYMGDDGQFTMYMDLPNNQYAYSSIAPEERRYQIENDIVIMFDNVRKDRYEK